MAPKILIVEDEEHLAMLMRDTLELSGFECEVDIAKDGVEGLVKIRSFKPDLVILDVQMPKKNGWQVCEEVRADPELKATPIIMCSAFAQKTDFERGETYGVKRYLTKPWQDTEALAAIKQVLSEKGAA